MRVLLTGCAGFIGFHLSKFLLDRGDEVVGVDNLNNFVYDNKIKSDRLDILENYDNFDFYYHEVNKIPNDLYGCDIVCHLAAHAGVRNSISSPEEYVNCNVLQFTNLLDKCKNKVKNFVFASSSSVYGGGKVFPSSELMDITKPISLYAATKAMDELLTYNYHHMFNIPITGLRFFTVYGPWGRPDMALMIFIKNIMEEKPIQLFNNGEMYRDFTYIDDIVRGIVKCLENPCKYEIFNIGRGKSEKLYDFVKIIEECCGKKAIIEFKPMQPGDVVNSWASTDKIFNFYNYRPNIDISVGIPKTVEWYKNYKNQK